MIQTQLPLPQRAAELKGTLKGTPEDTPEAREEVDRFLLSVERGEGGATALQKAIASVVREVAHPIDSSLEDWRLSRVLQTGLDCLSRGFPGLGVAMGVLVWDLSLHVYSDQPWLRALRQVEVQAETDAERTLASTALHAATGLPSDSSPRTVLGAATELLRSGEAVSMHPVDVQALFGLQASQRTGYFSGPAAAFHVGLSVLQDIAQNEHADPATRLMARTFSHIPGVDQERQIPAQREALMGIWARPKIDPAETYGWARRAYSEAQSARSMADEALDRAQNAQHVAREADYQARANQRW